MTDLDALLDTFRGMTVLELSEFTTRFESAFGVTAAVQQDAGPSSPPPDPVVEEQSEFTVTLRTVGQTKIAVIKEIRGLTKLGLKESKDLVDSAPVAVLEGVPRDVADAAAVKLAAVGAEVSVE